ncbi:uncharacterized protein [Periplaneta americana]|uniref:uncharacterized protein n=1 Tax=Periplaneta americana TaxID=6978 RepID=UPI0037E7FBDE
MTTVTERRIVREADHVPRRPRSPPPDQESKLSGILKGGKLWKTGESPQTSLSEADEPPDEADGKRSVRFYENQDKAAEQPKQEPEPTPPPPSETSEPELTPAEEAPAPQLPEDADCTELTLTFKLGQHHVLVANSLQRPNSAVRQLFPVQSDASTATEATSADGEKQQNESQFLVTAESLRMFEEAKRAKLAQFYGQEQADADDEGSRAQIRRTIERNTLRRSLLRYEPGNRNRLRGGGKTRAPQCDEDSLEERIRRLTCDLDEDEPAEQTDVATEETSSVETIMPPRASPQGEEARKQVPADKATSPSSASVTSSSSTSSSTYKKLTDLFARRSNAAVSETPPPGDWAEQHHHQGVPLDLGNGLPAPATSPGDQQKQGHFVGPKCAVSRASVTSEARKQFLSTLAPLAACVTSGAAHEDHEDADGGAGDEDYYHQQQQVVVTSPLSVAVPGDRMSVTSNSTAAGGEEYSLDDIDEVLAKEGSAPQPDVVAGTPAAEGALPASMPSSAPVDELALFVEQDAGRIERIKKRYNDANNNNDDDEHDDYGFNRRPSVRGIKPRFGSTTEILQQMQSQLQPPALLACPARSHVTWPYQESPELSTSPTADNSGVPRRRVPLGRGGMPPVQEELGSPYGNYSPTGILQAVSPTDRKDRRYVHHVMYPYQQQLSPSASPQQQQIMRIGGGCADYQQPGTRTPPLQHLQYPTASNSPPPSGLPRNYPAPGEVMTSLVPADGSVAPPGQYHHYPAGFQSLDRNASNLVTYGRRMTPPSGVVQMRISPVASATSPVGLHHHQPPPAHAVKLSTFNDPTLTAIIEPHYSVMPHPQSTASSRASPITTTSVIRVGHGQQQTIRVPYPSGTPVQVHLLTRGGSESPQRGSPLLATRPQYVVARGTQTGSLYPHARYYPNGAYMRQYLPDTATSPQQYLPDPGAMPGPRPYMVDGLKPPQAGQYMKQPPASPQPGGKMATSPVPTAAPPFSGGSPTRAPVASGERGVPEGAASCSPSFPQDAMYPQGQPPASSAVNNNASTPDSGAGTTSVYYAMNV